MIIFLSMFLGSVVSWLPDVRGRYKCTAKPFIYKMIRNFSFKTTPEEYCSFKNSDQQTFWGNQRLVID
jgi:hypothetical protein